MDYNEDIYVVLQISSRQNLRSNFKAVKKVKNERLMD
jgi:hypothetical protein